MNSQFDSIRDSWNDFNNLPNQRVCTANVGLLIKPLIQNGAVRVLDLACGTGHYARLCLDYGAAEVIGVDLSRAMLGAAVAVSKTEQYAVGSKLKFRVGDCKEPRIWSGGNFDLVLGMWMLNFAKNQNEVTDMLRTVEMNLKPGGTFVGCQLRRSNEPAETVALFDDEYLQRFGQSASVNEKIDNGLRVQIAAHVKPIPIEFECYLLRSEVTPASVLASGLDITSLDFPRIKVPDELRNLYPPNVFGKDYEREKASFSILTVKKGLPETDLEKSDRKDSLKPSHRPVSQYLNQKTWSHIVLGWTEP